MRYSYREVFIGANARMFSEWTQTSSMMAAVYETIRDTKKHTAPFSHEMWHPYLLRRSKTTEAPQVEPLEGLKMMYSLFAGNNK